MLMFNGYVRHIGIEEHISRVPAAANSQPALACRIAARAFTEMLLKSTLTPGGTLR